MLFWSNLYFSVILSCNIFYKAVDQLYIRSGFVSFDPHSIRIATVNHKFLKFSFNLSLIDLNLIFFFQLK